MIEFPSSTRKDIRLPKESFYTHATLTSCQKAMVDDIEQMYGAIPLQPKPST